MPRIPFAESQEQAPAVSGGVEQNPSVLNIAQPLAAQATEKLGAILTDTAAKGIDLVMKYQAMRQQADDAIEKVNLQTSIEKDKADFLHSLQSRTDPENFEDAFNQWSGQRADYYRQGLKNPDLWPLIQAHVVRSNEEVSIATRRLADEKKLQQDYMAFEGPGGARDTYQGLYAQTGNPEYVSQFKDQVSELVGSGALTAVQGASALHAVANGGDLVRAREAIDANPQAWINTVDKKSSYPYLLDGQLRDLDIYAINQASEKRKQAEQDKRDEYEKNAATIVDAMLKKAKDKKIFGFEDLDSMLIQMGHDPANGRLAILPGEELTLKNNIQARLDHLEVTGRRQPDMTPAKWQKYGALLDGIYGNPDSGIQPGSTSYMDVAKVSPILPDHLVEGLMSNVARSENRKITQEEKFVMNSIDGFRKTFQSPQLFNEIRGDVQTMIHSGEYKPDQWKSKAMEILSQKGSQDMLYRVRERLNLAPIPSGPTPPSSSSGLSGTYSGGKFTMGGKSYDVTNGTVTINGKRFRVDQLQ